MKHIAALLCASTFIITANTHCMFSWLGWNTQQKQTTQSNQLSISGLQELLKKTLTPPYLKYPHQNHETVTCGIDMAPRSNFYDVAFDNNHMAYTQFPSEFHKDTSIYIRDYTKKGLYVSNAHSPIGNPSLSFDASGSVIAYKGARRVSEITNQIMLFDIYKQKAGSINLADTRAFRMHKKNPRLAIMHNLFRKETSNETNCTVAKFDEDLKITFGSIIKNAFGNYWWNFEAHPEEALVATTPDDDKATLWDLQTGKEQSTFTYPGKAIEYIIWQRTGQLLALTGDNQRISFYSPKEKKEASWVNYPEQASSIQLDFATKFLTAFIWGEKKGKILNVSERKFVSSIEHDNPIRTMQICPKEELIASTEYYTGILKIWDMAGKLLRTYKLPFGYIMKVKWTPDGQLAVLENGDFPALYLLTRNYLKGETNEVKKIKVC